MSARRRKIAEPDCYDYIRGYYHVPAYIGVRIRRGERAGVLVDCRRSTQYLYVLFDETKAADILHPTDGIVYEVVGVDAPVVTA